ncbi:MAG: pilus assembly protein PilM [Candidatus Omnitrophota bacterium]
MLNIRDVFDKAAKRLKAVLERKTGRVLSIEFGRVFLKIVYIECCGEYPRLISYASSRIPEGEGREQKITDFIKDFQKNNSVSEKEAYFTVSDAEGIIIRHFSLPDLPKEELAEAVNWKLKEDASFDLGQALLGWQVVREYTDEEGAKKKDVVLFALRGDLKNRYIAIARACSLSPLGISANPFNYANILRRLKDGALVKAVLDIGYQDSSVCVYQDNKLIFIRRLTFSSHKLTQSLTENIFSDKGMIALSYEKAEGIKEAFGIPKDEAAALVDNIRAVHVISMMRPFLEGLIRELRYSFDYSVSNARTEWPSVVYLAGAGGRLKNLDWYLAKELNIKVSGLPLPEEINTATLEKERLQEEKCQVLGSIGASLLTQDSISLLPAEFKLQKIESIERFFLKAAIVVVAAVYLFFLFVSVVQIPYYKSKARRASSYLGGLGEIVAKEQKVYPLENLVAIVQQGRVPAEGLLKELTLLLPENVVLQELALDQDSRSLFLKGAILRNREGQEYALSALKEKIQTSIFFEKVEIVSSRGDGLSREFEMICRLVY